MKCEQARLTLWPKPVPPGDSPESTAALRHYAECPACQQFFAIQERLGARLRRLARGQRAPRRIHDGLQAALKHQPWSRGRRVTVLAGLAAAAAAALLLVARPQSTTDRLARPLVEAAIRDMPAESASGLDRNSLARWLAERLGHEVFVMDMPDGDLMGGYVTRVGDVPSAVMRYRVHDMPLTYVVVPGGRLLDRAVAEGEVIAVASRGLELLIWGEPSGAHVMVAPMPREQLKAIAEECRRQMRPAV